MDGPVIVKGKAWCMSMADFESLFAVRAIRTWVDWEALDDSNCTVRAAILTDVESLRRIHTVWYRNQGEPADWRDQAARRVSVGEEADRVTLDTLDRRLLDVPHVFPALDLGGGQLMLLDGNHRAVALAALGNPIHLLLLILEGPHEPLVFPDLIHEAEVSGPADKWLDKVAEIETKFYGSSDQSAGRPEKEATPLSLNDLEIPDLMEAYGKRLESEHSLMSSRMTWLLMLDSFLVAIIGVSLANLEKLQSQFAFGLILAVCAVGVVANSSGFFSNYWGGRAIDELSLVVTQELRRMTGPATRPRRRELTDEGKRWIARLRLYGRDPRSEPERIGFWRPPSGLMHPWFLVPLVFILTFATAPLFLAFAWQVGPFAVFLGSLCSGLGPFLFGAAAVADFVYHKTGSGLGSCEYLQLRWYRWRATSREAKLRHGRARRANRSELRTLRRDRRRRLLLASAKGQHVEKQIPDNVATAPWAE